MACGARSINLLQAVFCGQPALRPSHLPLRVENLSGTAGWINGVDRVRHLETGCNILLGLILCIDMLVDVRKACSDCHLGRDEKETPWLS